ncbi:MAG: L,D-transpeptidase family protein [Chromatiaceae bacterium]|nr:L,D-transpeptidase family protein [Chromatiaceae bacterium]
MIKAPCKPLPATDWLLKPLFATLAAAAIQFGVSGCVNLPLLEQEKPREQEPVQAEAPNPVLPMEPQEARPAKAKRWEWEGDNRKITHIWIDVDSQKARFYEGEEQVGWTYVASGLKSHPTPVGHFAVMGKEKTKESNLYGKIYNADGQVVVSDAKRGRHQVPAGGRFSGAKMPYFLRLTGDGVGLHAGAIPRPGHPASHGCIRLPAPFAQRLFSQVPIGTPVTITGTGPDYGDYRGRLAAQGAARQEPAEGGTLSPAEVAKIQPASAPVVQTEPVKPRPAPLLAAPIQTASTEPLKPGPTSVPAVQNEPVKPRPTPVQPMPPRTSPTEPLTSLSTHTPTTQPPYPQLRVARPQPPQNQSWKPLVTEGTLAVPVGVPPANHANPTSVAQPGSAPMGGTPEDKSVSPKPLQAGSTPPQSSLTSPQAPKTTAARPENPSALGQTPPQQAPEAPVREKAAPPTPVAPLGGVQTAPALTSPGSGAALPALPVAEQLPAKIAPMIQPLPSTNQAASPVEAKVPAEIKAPAAQAGKDQAKTEAESAPAVPLKADPG